MAPLKACLSLAALLWAVPAAADPLDRWQREMGEASARFGVPIEWIRRVMRAESGGRTMLSGRPVVSRAGAMGLMQVMPATWRAMRALHGLGPDPFNPRDNILAGTAYLRAMHDRFGYPGMLAAYNAGPGRYLAYLRGERALPAETVRYVRITTLDQSKMLRPAPVPASAMSSLFVGSPPPAEMGNTPTTPAPARAGLFVPLRSPANRAGS